MAKQLYVGDQVFVSQYGNSTITRGEYEDLMIPMISEEFSDEKMQKLVDNINLSMRSEYDEQDLKLLDRYRRGRGQLTQAEINRADRISEREFEHFECCARELGMRYWEDLDEREYRELQTMIDFLRADETA